MRYSIEKGKIQPQKESEAKHRLFVGSEAKKSIQDSQINQLRQAQQVIVPVSVSDLDIARRVKPPLKEGGLEIDLDPEPSPTKAGEGATSNGTNLPPGLVNDIREDAENTSGGREKAEPRRIKKQWYEKLGDDGDIGSKTIEIMHEEWLLLKVWRKTTLGRPTEVQGATWWKEMEMVQHMTQFEGPRLKRRWGNLPSGKSSKQRNYDKRHSS